MTVEVGKFYADAGEEAPREHADKSWDELLWETHCSGENTWDRSILHATDIGDCVRKVALRLAGAEVELSPKQRHQRDYMFALAFKIERDVAEAFLDHNMLVAYQPSLREVMPDHWTGAPDTVALVPYADIVDAKSSHPNWIRHTKRYPLPHHVKQLVSYEFWGGDYLGTHGAPKLWYKDRGGANPSLGHQGVDVPMPPGWLHDRPAAWELTTVREALDWCQDHYPDSVLTEMALSMWTMEVVYSDVNNNLLTPTGVGALYPVLDRAFDTKSNDTEIYLGEDWHCRYCDYPRTEFCPGSPTNTTGVWKLENGKWRPMRNATLEQRKAAVEWAATEVGVVLGD